MSSDTQRTSPLSRPIQRDVQSSGWWWRRSRATRTTISVLSIVVGVVIIAIPFAPWILYHALTPAPSFPYETKLSGTVYFPAVSDAARKKPAPLPEGNRLVIPKIGVDVEIVEGKDERSLYRGIWHFPDSSSPERGGNTVLTGHRFQYLSGPRTLYLLDQMKVGDVIIVYWAGKEYDYTIKERKIVNPDAVEILNDTPDPQLTVFTCTPLFTTTQRLVLIAEPLTQ